ncbi:MAG: hypothetical protein SFU53_03430 [Terrimicrobiaceae bacterium]|nr:hypothetical protein [Terrimicrobiaceae bacterium]
MRRLFEQPVARVGVNLRPRRGSWGGANQWTSQITRWFEYHRWGVRFDLSDRVDAILMTHTGLSKDTSFGVDEVEAFKRRNPGVPCIHRINDNDIRKNSGEMDAFLARSNRVADHTVFVSEWLRDYHAERWFDRSRPHSVIIPGADPRYFHPVGAVRWDGRSPLVFVTHHWSDNWNKGFDVYRDMDELFAGSLRGKFELWVVGRWPGEIIWKAARTFPPASGRELATILRGAHAYVSASRFEPGAMHVAEGLQCGLPLLYHPDSGGTVGQGRAYGMEIGGGLKESVEAFAARWAEFRQRVLADPPSGSRMAASYFHLVQRLVADA